MGGGKGVVYVSSGAIKWCDANVPLINLVGDCPKLSIPDHGEPLLYRGNSNCSKSYMLTVCFTQLRLQKLYRGSNGGSKNRTLAAAAADGSFPLHANRFVVSHAKTVLWKQQLYYF